MQAYMFNKLKLSILTFICIAFSFNLTAAELKVVWQEPDEYSDIREGLTQSKAGFRSFTFEQIEKFLTQQANKLPADQTLKITVTDLDLAGEVRFNSEEIRIIKDVYIPRISFTYELTDKLGNQLKFGKEELKNMAMSDSIIVKPSQDNYKYELYMLDRWFKRTFLHTDN